MSSQGSVSGSSSSLSSSAPFKSYGDYTRHIKQQQAAAATHEWDKELWLGQLLRGSKSIQWYRLSSQPKTESLQFEDHGTNTIPYKSTGSRRLFREQIKTSKQTVSWQILFCLINCGEPPKRFDIKEWDSDPSQWLFELTGLALNMPLDVCDHIADRLVGIKSLWRPAAGCTHDSPVLDIGLHSMVVLSTTDNELPPTVVNILPLNKGRSIFDAAISQHGVPAPIRQPRWIALTVNTPRGAAMTQNCVHEEAPESALIRNRVGQICSRTDLPSLTDAMFVCLTVILELHIDCPSANIPDFQDNDDEGEMLSLKYYRWPREKLHHKPIWLPEGHTQRVRVFTRSLWPSLRHELDMHRLFSERVSMFIQGHLSELPEDQMLTLQALVDRLRLRLSELELSELALKDKSSMYSSAKSTEMAERSIRESKRVILLTALAFFFLPISLASSIYGMNIQQINQTGHPIHYFIITAVAMCISAIVLWATIARLASCREMLQREAAQSEEWPDSKLKRLLYPGPKVLLDGWIYRVTEGAETAVDHVNRISRAIWARVFGLGTGQRDPGAPSVVSGQP